MSKFGNINNDFSTANNIEASDGLRAYMIKIYNYMGFGLILTGIVSYLVASSPYLMQMMYGTPLGMILSFAPLAFILVLSFGVNKLSASTAQILFWVFTIVMGASLSYILIMYTGTSIARVFLITAATFLTMSIYGYTTQRDLSKFGAILMMALIGIIIATIVNIFLKSSALQFGISIIGVIVFTGLTAWDTQRLKLQYQYVASNDEQLKKSAVFGALSLYLNFINLFLMLIRLVGERR